MRLNKFGAILMFAMDLEQRAIEFYGSAADARASRELEDSAAAARKRLVRLDTMRRELVNEMLLEPIAGFDPPALPEVETIPQDAAELEEARAEFEKARTEFYVAASAKVVTVAPALSRAFQRMAGGS
jgi:rubrerythrin